tara:strand:- start:86 stop:1081 length:996 start_codon:yes stop_codon:yes gene_type:complete
MTSVLEHNQWEGPLHILSLDGGGIKGLFSAAVLAKLEEDHGVRVIDHFDLIVGTSTGGILAIALGLGVPPAKLVEFYVEHGPSIFGGAPEGRVRGFIHSLRRRKYGNESLRESIQSVFGDRTLGESAKRLVIPTYNLGRDEVRLFKTAHHSRLKRDWKIPAWQIAMATSAAPTFFSAWRGIEDQRLVDGGVWANNPTMVGIIEAKSVLGASLDQIRVLSLGTCDELVHRPDELDEGGLLAWKSQALKVIMRGQSVGTDNLAGLLLGRERVRRVDPKVPNKLFLLDKTDTMDKLIAEAAHTSQHLGPLFTSEFIPHVAVPFRPYLPAQEANL